MEQKIVSLNVKGFVPAFSIQPPRLNKTQMRVERTLFSAKFQSADTSFTGKPLLRLENIRQNNGIERTTNPSYKVNQSFQPKQYRNILAPSRSINAYMAIDAPKGKRRQAVMPSGPNVRKGIRMSLQLERMPMMSRREKVSANLLNNDKIAKICFTGGPCGGKTTAIQLIQKRLTAKGFKVLVVPEAARTLISGGANIASTTFTPSQGQEFQKTLMSLQMQLEDSFQTFASLSSEPTILLIDRGLMDGSAYVPAEQWDGLMQDMELKTEDISDNRYDAVIHMVTAADGAESTYSDNTRYESIAEAIEKDQLLLEAYNAHKNQIIIDNKSCENFDAKVTLAEEAVERFLKLQKYD